MSVDTKGLALLIQEACRLSNKPRLDEQEKRRNAWLLAAIATMKLGGITLAELDQQDANERSVAAGLDPVEFSKPTAVTAELRMANAIKHFTLKGENRGMIEGVPLTSQIGTYTDLGYFVPTGFFPELFRAMKAHDALFDEDFCTVIKTTNGRPLPIPVAGDTENTASVVTEAGSRNIVNFYSTSHAVLGAWSYASDRYVISMEALQDMDALTFSSLAQQFFQDKLARGIGYDLVTGNGSGKPKGLLTSLSNLGVPEITASGSAANTGGGETGANSLGSADFANALAALDDAYVGPKTAWLMNKKTLAYLSSIVTKYGQPLKLVEYVDGEPTIYGIPVSIAPSMDLVGASKVPVILGDFRYWATRLITGDEGVGLMQYGEADGLVENGNVGLGCFLRADGALLYDDTDSPAPFVPIRNFS